ncbi:MAG: peptidoglycan editing factor PgeF [Desulfotomaculales bacterium]
MGWQQVRAGSLVYFDIHFPAQRVTAVFSTRLGGVSRGAYAELNLGFHVGDDPGAVLANRRTLLKSIGFNIDDLVCAEQVHAAGVKLVGSNERGRGARSEKDALTGIDGMVTGIPGVVLGAFFADCVPVFLADVRGRCIGLVHAGWRGTVARIVKTAIDVMCSAYHLSPASIAVVIGPAIGRCCYEVGNEVAAPVRDAGLHSFIEQVAPGKWRFGLAEANRQILLASGVAPQLIRIMPFCTACNGELFYSHRGTGGRTGRMGAFMALKAG